ncbi:alpha/beta-Hydrolases superfamily protein [Striga hermonthica]|uniref:Alpha/beta-Hydrolases superfamily protein n=1 Tax=Striga hermonthica TaxID=68872 RepID=A0A9N7NVC4_STRHE|nr:alpha/beta-Hydrolases superfamily protein [Striga hermonthica]
MACTLSHVSSSPRDSPENGLRRSFSAKDLQRRAGIRRSVSDNNLCYPAGSIKASSAQPKLKTSRSVGFFNINLSSTMIHDTFRSFLFEPEPSPKDMMKADDETSGFSEDDGEKKRANWVERLVELRDDWRDRKDEEEVGDDVEGGGCDEEGGCVVEYDDVDSDDEKGGAEEISIDRDTFTSLLTNVSWSDTKKFSQLAFLCNMAYKIPDMKTEDLRRYYGLEFVTSSLEKKAEAKEKVERDSTKTKLEYEKNPEQMKPPRARTYDQIAVSAASFVQSRVKEETGGGCSRAACVAASTVTAVVAAGEKEKEKAAKDLQSLHSSPCEWFVCDDPGIYTRCFVIQGSDSLASWQANLLFEPTKFEGTDVLVHRGIYEAAKGIYEQLMPEIKQHLEKYGYRARLQFTGHSLGGSLALLVNLMLLARNEVGPSSLLPVVTFGSPFVFCMGQKILDCLGLDEDHVQCVLMHRDIVPRAFSCNYPDYVAQVLKRLNGTFRLHPCLNKNKLLYSPMGKIFILQPNEKSSPPHPLLPPGGALYALTNTNVSSLSKSAVRAFMNSPHPIETLSDPAAYGLEGNIVRDHDSSNYLKAVNEVIRQHTRLVVRKAREERNQLWPLLTSRSPHAWSHTCHVEGRETRASEKMLTGV